MMICLMKLKFSEKPTSKIKKRVRPKNFLKKTKTLEPLPIKSHMILKSTNPMNDLICNKDRRPNRVMSKKDIKILHPKD